MNNYIHDNNLPPGGGILLMGVSDNNLVGNRFKGNRCATYSFIPGGVEQVPAPCR